MSDTLDSDGLTLESLSDITDDLTSDFQDIYGDDINTDSDTPDGQLIGIIAQMARDIRDIIQDVYTSMDPDEAEGKVLDQRCAINGIERNAGSFTIVPVDITATTTVSLVGLDDDSESVDDIPSDVFTVSDDSGNEFYLLDSVNLNSGETSCSFRAADKGDVEVSVNTITTISTATSGISSVNNSEGVTTQGEDEETDANLRIRRENSLAVSSQGYTDSILAAILDLDDVTTAFVEENTGDSEDDNGIPAHGIWVIVQGGDDDDIAEAIYEKRPCGIAMKGDEEVYVTRSNGSTAVMYFDRPTSVPLYVKMSVTLKDGSSVDTDDIIDDIVDNISYSIGDDASTDTFIAYIKGLDSDYIITGCEISTDDSNWYETITCPSLDSRFTLDTDDITIT